MHFTASILISVHYVVDLYTPDTPLGRGRWVGGIVDETVPAGAGTVGRITSPMTMIILRPSEHCPPEFLDASLALTSCPFE